MVACSTLLALLSTFVVAGDSAPPLEPFGRLTFQEGEKACLKLRGTVVAPTEPKFEEYLHGLSQRGPYWALYSDPLGNDTKNENYVDCYAIDTSHKDSAGHYKMITKGCNSELPVVCSVADDKKCNGKRELYSNGYCYKVIGGSREFDDKKSEKACEKDGAKLASIHSAAENHAIRLLLGDAFPNKGDACIHLGFRFAANGDMFNATKHSPGKVYDGSSFDFGFQECDVYGRYPWCPREPECGFPNVVMFTEYSGGKHCWMGIADAAAMRCAALCKKKLD